MYKRAPSAFPARPLQRGDRCANGWRALICGVARLLDNLAAHDKRGITWILLIGVWRILKHGGHNLRICGIAVAAGPCIPTALIVVNGPNRRAVNVKVDIMPLKRILAAGNTKRSRLAQACDGDAVRASSVQHT